MRICPFVLFIRRVQGSRELLLASKCDYSYKVAGVALWPLQLPHATCHTRSLRYQNCLQKSCYLASFFFSAFLVSIFCCPPKNVRKLQNVAAAAAATAPAPTPAPAPIPAMAAAAVIFATLAACSYNFLGAIIALIAM